MSTAHPQPPDDPRLVSGSSGPGLSNTAHNSPHLLDRGAYVTYSREGSVIRIHPDNTDTSAGSPVRRGGGIRKKIKGFTRASRARFREFLASMPSYIRRNSQLVEMGLTFPDTFPNDYKLCKKMVQAFGKRLRREYGDFPVVWKQETQARGAPHYHLVCFMPSSAIGSGWALRRMRGFVARAWYEVCGEVSDDHLKAGTHLEEVRDWLSTAKYLAKAETLADTAEDDAPEGEEQSPGRYWGVWNEELLGITWEKVRISQRDFFEIRRILRRLVGLKPRAAVRAMRIFAKDAIVRDKILPFFGYPPT